MSKPATDQTRETKETIAQPSLWRRILGQHLMYAALLVLMTMTMAGTLVDGSELKVDPDLWWHLADARHLFEAHSFIRVEPYAFTVAGQRWVNPEWLAEVPYWFGYKTGGLLGLHLTAVFIFCANLLLIYFRGAAKSGNKAAAFWTSVLCFFLLTVNNGARTILVAYIALAIELMVIEAAEKGRTRALWLLPPLFCVWINLHGSWVIGLGLLGLYILCGLARVSVSGLEQAGFARSDRNRLFAVFAASVAALLVNPYGWLLIWNPFDMMFSQKLQIAITEEWQPLNIGSVFGRAAAAFFVLMIVANFVRGRKWKVHELAFALFSWYVAFSHVRFLVLACVIMAPMLAADLARAFFSQPSEKTMPILNGLIAVGVIVTAAMVTPKPAVLQKQLGDWYPLRSIAAIEPGWHTFNEHPIGGMMAFNGKANFIDSRNDIFDHRGVMADYLAILNNRDTLKLLDHYSVDHALIKANLPLAAVLAVAGWREVMREGTGDNAYVLLAKTR